jgi:hypothetical protein
MGNSGPEGVPIFMPKYKLRVAKDVKLFPKDATPYVNRPRILIVATDKLTEKRFLVQLFSNRSYGAIDMMTVNFR